MCIRDRARPVRRHGSSRGSARWRPPSPRSRTCSCRSPGAPRLPARPWRRDGGTMNRLLALVRKEFLQLRRDTITLRMIVIVPILQTLIFGYAINYDVKHLRTVVLDEDKSYDSRELVAKMTASEYFDIVRYVDSEAALRHEIDAGHASVGLVIDHDYGKDRRRGACPYRSRGRSRGRPRRGRRRSRGAARPRNRRTSRCRSTRSPSSWRRARGCRTTCLRRGPPSGGA